MGIHKQILPRLLDPSGYLKIFYPKLARTDPTKAKPQKWSVQDDG